MSVWVVRSRRARRFPLERVHRPLLHNGLGARAGRGGVLERLVAGVIVIGILLWGASLLATPDAATPEPVEEPVEPPVEGEAPTGHDWDDDREDHDDEDDDPREESKRKKGRGG